MKTKSKLRFVVLLALMHHANVCLTANLEQAANDGCECLKTPHAKMEELAPVVQEAMDTQDMSKIMALQGEMMQVIDGSNECFGELKKKYPEIDQSDELREEVTNLMKQKCPRPDLGIEMPGQTQ